MHFVRREAIGDPQFWDAEARSAMALSHDVRDEQTLIVISRLTTIETLFFTSTDPCDDWLRHLEPAFRACGELELSVPKVDRPGAIPHLCKLRRLEYFNADCKRNDG